ncbi:hypothetical protein [Pontibacter beigongshangensis]|uniref:hypothetical protein n=1 Tax=Pontibacter beigongshangensis TaxID=2574733 RepID=UPI00164F628F|nr:hypothetical protein [Pontibacter beigongshangensis]
MEDSRVIIQQEINTADLAHKYPRFTGHCLKGLLLNVAAVSDHELGSNHSVEHRWEAKNSHILQPRLLKVTSAKLAETASNVEQQHSETAINSLSNVQQRLNCCFCCIEIPPFYRAVVVKLY